MFWTTLSFSTLVPMCMIASGLSDRCDPFETIVLDFPDEENIVVSMRVVPAIFLVHTEVMNGYANCDNVEQSSQRNDDTDKAKDKTLFSP